MLAGTLTFFQSGRFSDDNKLVLIGKRRTYIVAKMGNEDVYNLDTYILF